MQGVAVEEARRQDDERDYSKEDLRIGSSGFARVRRETLGKRILKVSKWLAMTPVVAVCAACGQEFKVAGKDIKQTRAAQENLQAQFDRHECRDGEKT